MNIPAILSLFRVARDPTLCLPHATVSTFADLPIPLSRAFPRRRTEAGSTYNEKHDFVDIRAVVLDKDNCFAIPHTDEVYPAYSEKFKALLTTYTPSNILIVSNSSGTLSKDPNGTAADILERNTGVTVLRHTLKKPACGDEIMAWFRQQAQAREAGQDHEKSGGHDEAKAVTHPSQICVIGDRLFTDVVLANTMGARAIWIKKGVVPDRGVVTRVEYGLEAWLRRRGWADRLGAR